MCSEAGTGIRRNRALEREELARPAPDEGKRLTRARGEKGKVHHRVSPASANVGGKEDEGRKGSAALQSSGGKAALTRGCAKKERGADPLGGRKSEGLYGGGKKKGRGGRLIVCLHAYKRGKGERAGREEKGPRRKGGRRIIGRPKGGAKKGAPLPKKGGEKARTFAVGGSNGLKRKTGPPRRERDKKRVTVAATCRS